MINGYINERLCLFIVSHILSVRRLTVYGMCLSDRIDADGQGGAVYSLNSLAAARICPATNIFTECQLYRLRFALRRMILPAFYRMTT